MEGEDVDTARRYLMIALTVMIVTKKIVVFLI